MIVSSRYHAPIPRELSQQSIPTLIEAKIINEKEIIQCPNNHGEYEAVPLYPFFSSIVYSSCPKCEEERAKKREEEAIIKREEEAISAKEQRLRILRDRGCDAHYIRLIQNGGEIKKDTEFFNKQLAGREEKVRDLLEYSNDLQDFKLNQNLIILGACGVGKSYLAYSLIDTAREHGLIYKCKEMSEIVSLYRNGEGEGFRNLNSIENLKGLINGLHCLIIDEVDTSLKKESKDAESLSAIIRLCNFEGVRLIIMGNCNRKEFEEFLEEKIKSRLAGSIVISGWGFDDLRKNP